GTLQTATFENVWRSNVYQQFRTLLLHSRSSVEMCQNCTEGTKVWA
ncbi:MAG: SPASM domain-containing protein, partial [Flammeovirgaceae bacterium]|nr:SPASM domain-containing protein [Flammeovirgaceae bacterium]MDW8288161.1 SPASM domain-containing protein [Flammeovirgaceae bacterium]